MLSIFLISDENYAKYTAITIQSIMSGSKEKISFYLLDGGITEESKARISEMVAKESNSIEFIPMDISLFENFRISPIFHLTHIFAT